MKKIIVSLGVILIALGAAAWLKRTDIILAFAKYQSSQRYADIGPARDVSWQQGPTAAAESMSERQPENTTSSWSSCSAQRPGATVT